MLLITDADRHALQFFLRRSLQRATLLLQRYLYKVAVVRGRQIVFITIAVARYVERCAVGVVGKFTCNEAA